MRPTDAELATLLREAADEMRGTPTGLMVRLLNAADALASSGAPAVGKSPDLAALAAAIEGEFCTGHAEGCHHRFDGEEMSGCDCGHNAARQALEELCELAAPPRSPAPPSGEAWRSDEKVKAAREVVEKAIVDYADIARGARPGSLVKQADYGTTAIDELCAAVAASVQQGEQP